MVVFYSSASPSPGLCPHSFLYKILLSGCSGMVITASCGVATKTFLGIKGSQHSQVDSAGTGAARLSLMRDQKSPLSCNDGSGHQGAAMKSWDPCDFSSYSKLVQSLLIIPYSLVADSFSQTRIIYLFIHIYKIYDKYTPKIKKGLILLPQQQCLKQQMDCGCSASIYSLFRPLISFALKASGF